MTGKITAVVLLLVALPCFGQSNLLQITSPPSGTIVYPGQVVVISVYADPSVSNVAIMGQSPLGFSQTTNGQSLQFQLTIPSSTTIGAYNVNAVGTGSNGSLVASPAISIQVDTQGSAILSGTQPSVLRFSAPGATIPLHIMGLLPNGSQTDITHSVQMSYSSENPQIATVDGNGIVTAVALGSTHIIVSNPNVTYYVSSEVGQLAKMSYPGLASTLPGSSFTFQWIGSNTATAYRIEAGSTQGGNNYYDSGSLPTTTLAQTINTLPTDGSTIYVTLLTPGAPGLAGFETWDFVNESSAPKLKLVELTNVPAVIFARVSKTARPGAPRSGLPHASRLRTEAQASHSPANPIVISFA